MATALTASHVEMLLPAAPSQEQAEWARALLVPMVDQFNLMQNQMFEQFQQALLMMFQQFSTLHNDQMSQLRGELERIREITEELEDLKAALRELPKTAPEPSPVTAPVRATSPRTGVDYQAAARPQSPAPPKSALAEAAKLPPLAPVAAAAASGRSPAEIHALLSQRISAMQQERQTRWEKIVNFFTGRAGT